MIYLDNAATTKPCKEAVKAAVAALTDNFGNPSSRHFVGTQAEKILADARGTIAKALSTDEKCIFFTSGATESNNWAIKGAAENRIKRKPRVVTTTVEHPSVKEAVKALEKLGAEIVWVSPDENGEITAESIVNAVDDKTCLVSCMLVNNETGYVLPVAESFAAIKRKYPDCMTHCDAVQGFMKLPVKVNTLCADLISVSGHKVYAPKGVGALYIKKGVNITTFMQGGGQEGGKRSGTENIPAIAGFAAAVKKLSGSINQRYENACALRDTLYNSIADDIVINSRAGALPYICSIAMVGYKSETLLNFMSERGICVSSGSACSKGKKSSVLKALGIPDNVADSTLRVSFSCDTTPQEVEQFVQTLQQARALASTGKKRK